MEHRQTLKVETLEIGMGEFSSCDLEELMPEATPEMLKETFGGLKHLIYKDKPMEVDIHSPFLLKKLLDACRSSIETLEVGQREMTTRPQHHLAMCDLLKEIRMRNLKTLSIKDGDFYHIDALTTFFRNHKSSLRELKPEHLNLDCDHQDNDQTWWHMVIKPLGTESELRKCSLVGLKDQNMFMPGFTTHEGGIRKFKVEDDDVEVVREKLLERAVRQIAELDDPLDDVEIEARRLLYARRFLKLRLR